MTRLHRCILPITAATFLAACATEPEPDAPLDYELLTHTGNVEAPRPEAGRYAPADKDAIDRGRYLVVLLGCGACHTHGAFEGAPDSARALAGSGIGIAWTNPLENERPGVIYPPNITPDEQTGIGLWSDARIASAIRDGAGRHGARPLVSMPWQSYARLNDDDLEAIVAYLRAIPPIEHRVPDEVRPGQTATAPFVYFGVYRSRD
jgi:mono/diheme cytochrome c family protein